MRRSLTAFFLIMALTAQAQVDPETFAEDFADRTGYERLDLDRLDAALDAALSETDFAQKDADVTPIEKALLLVELYEAPLPRTRYVVRLAMTWSGEIPVSFVEVSRYNMGPAIRAELVEAYGAENVAKPEEFGAGPHVSWRIVTQPTVKSAALVLAASRRDIPEIEALADLCPAQLCLSVGQMASLANWAPAPADDQLPPPMAYETQLGSPDTPHSDAVVLGQSTALIAIRLALAAGFAATSDDGILWSINPDSDPATPFAEWVIDRDLGQDFGIEGFLRIAPLDQPEPRWLRLTTTGAPGSTATLWTIPGDLPVDPSFIPQAEN